MKYDPSFVKQVKKICLLGATDAQLAEFFGVDRKTIFRWLKDYPDFAVARRDRPRAR
jgi:transposase